MIRIISFPLLVVVLAGCQSKLRDSRTLDVEIGSINTIHIDGPRYDQKVTVEFTSSDGPVGVYVCLRKDEREVGADADTGHTHPAALGSVARAVSGTIEVSIPAKQEFSIMVFAAGKRTTVSLKITGN
jgi:hypothetical protein